MKMPTLCVLFCFLKAGTESVEKNVDRFFVNRCGEVIPYKVYHKDNGEFEVRPYTAKDRILDRVAVLLDLKDRR
jgi:hypothetical protein